MRSKTGARPGVRGRRGLTVALVGADGAGKSEVTRLLGTADLPAPLKTIYMGVNLDASTLMLPTTRALLAVRRARGRRPDLVASALQPAAETGRPPLPERLLRSGKSAARLGVWASEEWLRQLVAVGYLRRGRIVVFDRHFFADYYYATQSAPGRRVPWSARLHGWMLRTLYPTPDLVLCLDAPGELLYARKPEASAAWLEERRQQYLRLADVLPQLRVVDATRPVEAVLADVVAAIRSAWQGDGA
jgi:thymidylate kinase